MKALYEVDPWTIISDWWGEPVSEELVNRVRQAPSAHLAEFAEFASAAALNSSEQLPELKPGEIRPLLLETGSDSFQHRDEFRRIASAAQLLTFAHQVAVEEPFIHSPLQARPHESAALLERLLQVRPLGGNGLRFIRVDERDRHPSRNFGLMRFQDIDERLLREYGDGLAAAQQEAEAADAATLSFSLRNYMGLALRTAIANPGSVHALSRTKLEEVLTKIAVANGATLSSRTEALRLQDLARIPIPNVGLPVESLVRVRSDEERWSEWRASLRAALSELEQLPESERWTSIATEIINDELAGATQKLERAVGRSPATSAAKVTSRTLTLSAIGSFAGFAAGGALVPGLVGAGAGKMGEAIYSYLNFRREQRLDRAVLDVALSFHA